MRWPRYALLPITALLLAFVSGPAGAAEIGPGEDAKGSAGVSLLEIGRWILIVLAFVAIFGALVVKLRVARSLRSETRDQSNAW